MLVSEARTRARTLTSHDSDDQIDTPQFLTFIQDAQDRIRRRLATAIPTLYNAVHAPAGYTLTAGQTTLAQPADFLSAVRMEKQYGTIWYPVWVANGLDTHGLRRGLEFYERGSDFIVAPEDEAPGSYRLTYVQTSTVLTADGNTIQVPPGFERAVVELVCADVRIRCEEDPSPHLLRFDDGNGNGFYPEALKSAKRRYGNHPVSGLIRARGDS